MINWINDQEISDNEAVKFLELAKVCINQSKFKWDEKLINKQKFKSSKL